MPLRNCIDAPVVPYSSFGCEANTRLCRGVYTILHNASCGELGSLPFLVSLIERIGLAGDLRGHVIYGPKSKSMNRPGSRSGLWQDPTQIASAILRLGSRLRREPQALFRYVEVGVFTAWTSCVVAAYLRRAGGGTPFSGWAVDIKMGNIHPSTLKLLTQLNMSFQSRAKLDSSIAAAQARAPQTPLADPSHNAPPAAQDSSHSCPILFPISSRRLPADANQK